MRCSSYTKCVLAAVLLVAAGCPTIEVDPKGLEGQAGSAPNHGHAGKSGGRAGKGGSAAAGSGVDPEEEGFAGSPAPADQDEVAGRGGAGGAGGSGGSGNAAGKPGTGQIGKPLAGRGGAGGSGGSAAGSGGSISHAAGSGGSVSHAAGSGGSVSHAAGSGGSGGRGPVVIGSVSSDTKLSDIKTDADAQALCAILSSQIHEAYLRTIQRGSCTLEAITDELRGLGECLELSDKCIAAAEQEEIQTECNAEDIPDCTNVTMGEYVACTKESVEASSKLFATFTCETDLENVSEPPVPAACAAIYQKCPELNGPETF